MPAKSTEASFDKVLKCRGSSNPVMTNSGEHYQCQPKPAVLGRGSADYCYCRCHNSHKTINGEREAAHNGGGGYSHSQQMGSAASSPEGNSKTEPVKSATIHDGKCFTFRANANGSHVRSKTEQGRAMRNEAQSKNVTNSLSADCFSGRWTTPSNELPLTDASDIQAAVVTVSAETQPVPHFSKSLDGSCCCCWLLTEMAIMLMWIILGTFAVRMQVMDAGKTSALVPLM